MYELYKEKKKKKKKGNTHGEGLLRSELRHCPKTLSTARSLIFLSAHYSYYEIIEMLGADHILCCVKNLPSKCKCFIYCNVIIV